MAKTKKEVKTEAVQETKATPEVKLLTATIPLVWPEVGSKNPEIPHITEGSFKKSAAEYTGGYHPYATIYDSQEDYMELFGKEHDSTIVTDYVRYGVDLRRVIGDVTKITKKTVTVVIPETNANIIEGTLAVARFFYEPDEKNQFLLKKGTIAHIVEVALIRQQPKEEGDAPIEEEIPAEKVTGTVE